MTDVNKWQRKVDALIRLADDQRGKPEGDLAREKLVEILNKHPEAQEYPPIIELAERDFTMGDLYAMKRQGISTGGSWTGRNIQEAMKMMTDDYRTRLNARSLGEGDDNLE